MLLVNYCYFAILLLFWCYCNACVLLCHFAIVLFC